MTIEGSFQTANRLFTNVTGGSITIGNPSQSGTMTIEGSTNGNTNLFTNVTGGSINIGTSLLGGSLTIGKPGSNMSLSGNLTRIIGSTGNPYYIDGIITITTTPVTLSGTLYKYYIYDNNADGTIILPTPSINYLGIELVFRSVNGGNRPRIEVPSLAALFIPLTNNVHVNHLGPTNIIRVVCGIHTTAIPPNTPYWIQLQ